MYWCLLLTKNPFSCQKVFKSKNQAALQPPKYAQLFFIHNQIVCIIHIPVLPCVSDNGKR